MATRKKKGKQKKGPNKLNKQWQTQRTKAKN